MEFLAVAITHPSPELIIQLHLVTPQLPITLVLPKRTHVSPHEKYLWTALMAVTSGSMISPTAGRGNRRKERWCDSPRITYLEGQPLCCSASFRFQALHWGQRAGIPWAGPICMVSSVTQSCPTLCNPMNHSTLGLPVHHQLLEFTQTHVHRVGDAIQPSHPLSSPSPPAPNPSQHQGLFQWVNFSHEVAKVLEFQL